MDIDVYSGSYFVIEMSNDGSATAKAIYEYADLNAAMIAYHNTLASIRGNAAVKWGMVQVINEYGTESAKERFERHDDE